MCTHTELLNDTDSAQLLYHVTVQSGASKDRGVQNVQQLEGSYTVLLYFTLCTIMCTYRELLNDIDNTVVISCYCLTFIPY